MVKGPQTHQNAWFVYYIYIKRVTCLVQVKGVILWLQKNFLREQL